METDKIETAVSDIAADLFQNKEPAEETAPPEETNTETVPAETTAETGTETTATETTDTAKPAAAAAVEKLPAPKSFKQDLHGLWDTIPRQAQEYYIQREKQMLDGISQYSDKAKRADLWDGAVKDYLPLIQAQGAQPHEAVRYLFEAHRQLSSGTPEQRAAYLVKVAESYGIDLGKAQAVAGAAAQEPASVKELRERTERLERERAQEVEARNAEIGQKVSNEVTAFADAKDEKGNPKHPYFDECAEDIVALINAGHTLQQAYEKAVYANPVTRAKELDRVRKADEEALRAKAKKEAEAARNASRTNVNSRDTRRTPTAPPAKKWEDTLEETMKEIKSRTH